MYDKTPLQTLDFHRSMLADEERCLGYMRAIFKTVHPGDVVLDIGSGTGILGLFACLAGARHVYALEQDAVIEVARQICRHNGFEERVTFVKDWSTNVELPERVDVVITETIGNIGFEEGILGWVIDARDRLLVPGGRIVPQAVELVAVPVEHPAAYRPVDVWLGDFFSFDFSAARAVAANNLHWIDLSPESFLSEPMRLARVDLAEVPGTDVSGSASYEVTREGALHGIGGWFASELAPGIRLSNAPPNQTPSWMHGFLPLVQPLPVAPGDRLRVEIEADANSAQWAWRVSMDGYTVHESTASSDIPHSDQTTRSGQLLSPTNRRTLELAPMRSQDAAVDFFVLQQMDGARTVEDVARQVAARFPAHLSFDHALARVHNLVEYYGCRMSSDSKPNGGAK
jgi:predicted RNA methylase